MSGTTLTHPQADVIIEEVGDGKRLIKVGKLSLPAVAGPRLSIVTSYSLELIARLMEVKGPAWLCDEIARDEDPNYVEGVLRSTILSYLEPEEFAGKRILDLGCGCGASTIILARMFPTAEILGTDWLAGHISVAKDRAAFYGLSTVSFRVPDSSMNLPDGIGVFDFVIMNGVYEHLLPAERKELMADMWSHLRPGGIAFIDETPNRSFPVENHTTGLPLINYLPDGLALFVARKLSKRIHHEESWESLLRRGVRGGTVREIVRNLTRGSDAKPVVLKPSRLGCRDQIDIWHMQPGGKLQRKTRAVLRSMFKVINAVTCIMLAPNLALAIRKAKQ